MSIFSNRKRTSDKFWSRGEPMVWASGGALGAILLGAVVLLFVLLANGLAYFWPSPLEELQLVDGTRLLGRRLISLSTDKQNQGFPFRTANRGFDLTTQAIRQVKYKDVVSSSFPPDAAAVERLENSDFYGTFVAIEAPGLALPTENDFEQLSAARRLAAARQASELNPLLEQISALSAERAALDDRRLRLLYKLQLAKAAKPPDVDKLTAINAQIADCKAQLDAIDKQSSKFVAARIKADAALRGDVAVFRDCAGNRRRIALVDIVRVYRPNSMGLWAKLGLYFGKVWELLATEPRESNTEGGVLPAIFGTVTLIFLMAISSFPLGVLAGIYLGEYAQDGALVRLVRIGVNNLAGIPSIVYGIFGAGFFIDYLGAHIDRQFFPYLEGVRPVFNNGGVLWAALTLGLLTVPVVIVATEEAIRVIPRGVRESSFALGSTKLQTLVRVLFPLASPGVLTGFILAMARAAGEVAPLMLTGVVLSAPTLPIDGTWPYFHLERQFMHLGYLIKAAAFQSPNAEAARPLVFAIALLLVLIVLVLSGLAIVLRNRMRKNLQIRTI